MRTIRCSVPTACGGFKAIPAETSSGNIIRRLVFLTPADRYSGYCRRLMTHDSIKGNETPRMPQNNGQTRLREIKCLLDIMKNIILAEDFPQIGGIIYWL